MESRPTMFVNVLLGFVLGGLVNELILKVKVLPLGKGFVLNVKVTLMLFVLVLVQVTAPTNDPAVQEGVVGTVISAGKAN